jgi:hypothetical protein
MTVTLTSNGEHVTYIDVSFIEIRADEDITFEAVAENDVQIWKTHEEEN